MMRQTMEGLVARVAAPPPQLPPQVLPMSEEGTQQLVMPSQGPDLREQLPRITLKQPDELTGRRNTVERFITDTNDYFTNAPEGILSSPPRATDAAATAMPLEALVSPDEGRPSAPRTDGGKNRKRIISGRETTSLGQGSKRMGRKILEEEDAVRMRGRMLYRTFQAAGEGSLGFRETPVGLLPQGPGGGGGA
uniref:Uncharacterized protein n=1 Tax=Chromera velia CCMP2878 TaxID=1169474 RepID=A0A0G4I4Y7_9ALVE|eukprot:Cvel_10967.t1-p1 / transcript=Cvel_10967.t1 / gene=Cvel_10967 / organism=Chromera_velia_CCMP2878 / gene_product=hypothetical protein / transcript_product=hypothetical protein / location=Cvel_scaffold674:72389-73621(+) / protein_length=192 / sequence_SO=supercontig / SO=protein_coding / is_pseudo=false